MILDLDKYTLLHLIHILQVNDVLIQCEWNRESIMKIFETIDIHTLEYICKSECNYKSNYTVDWRSCNNIQIITVNITIEWDSIIGERMYKCFSFSDGNIIKLPDNNDNYRIAIIYDDYDGYDEPYVIIYCISVENDRLYTKMPVEEFVYMIENDNITII
jgi:hypothetical protein